MILITGGLGFLGVNLAKCLLDEGRQVLLTRNRNSHVPDLLAPFVDKGLTIAPMNVTDLSTIIEAIRKYRVTSIIHAASIHEGQGSLFQVVDVNVTGTGYLLEAARLMGLGRFTFVSSESANQGRKGTTPLKEEEFIWVRSDRYIPVTKKMGELLCLMYKQHYKMDVVITRPSRVYGPFYAAGRNPILRMVTAVVRGGTTTFSDIDSTEGHDFVYVRDCAKAHALIHCADSPRHDIYNVGLGHYHTFGDVARVLEKLSPGTKMRLGEGLGTITKTEFDIEACLDVTRIADEFGFMPEYDLERGVGALASWIKDGSYL